MNVCKCILSAITVCVSIFNVNAQTYTANYAQKAAAMIINGNYFDAVTYADSAVNEQSSSVRLMLKGDAMLLNGNVENAINFYVSAEKSLPAEALFAQARAAASLGNSQQAVDALKKLFTRSNRPLVNAILNDSLICLIKNSSEFSLFEKSIILKPWENDLLSAQRFVEKKQTLYAFESLNKIIKKYPAVHQAYFLRAKAYMIDNNTKSALPDIEKAAQLNKNNPEYLEYEAYILNIEKKYQRAAQCLISALDINETRIFNLINIAVNYYAAELYQQAAEYARVALQLLPRNKDAIEIYALTACANDDCTAALQALNSLKSNKSAMYFKIRGDIYLKSEAYEFAINDYHTALDLDPSLTEIYLNKGLAEYFSGNKDTARGDWETALKYKYSKAAEYLQKNR